MVPLSPTTTHSEVTGHETLLPPNSASDQVAPPSVVSTAPVPMAPSPTATHVVVDGQEIEFKVPAFVGMASAVHVVPPFAVATTADELPVAPTAVHVVVEGHEIPESVSTCEGIVSGVHVAPPFVVPMATATPPTGAVVPTAVQSTAEGQETPSRDTPEGALSATQLAPLSAVASTKPALTPVVPTTTQFVVVGHEIPLMLPGVGVKFLSTCHDPGAPAAAACDAPRTAGPTTRHYSDQPGQHCHSEQRRCGAAQTTWHIRPPLRAVDLQAIPHYDPPPWQRGSERGASASCALPKDAEWYIGPDLAALFFGVRSPGREERPPGVPIFARRLLRVELHGYHPREWVIPRVISPSQRYGFELVRAAMDRGAVIVVARCMRHWHAAVPDLGNMRTRSGWHLREVAI